MFISTMTMHGGNGMCGTATEVQHFADHIIAERGVRYGRLVIERAETA